ncbi:MAG TPA: hypothetical protein VGH37_01710 [Candidatus Acidoferrum sp.]|jgi:hypothetical protein
MTHRSRYLLIAMSVAFGICIIGVAGGMLYYLSAVYIWHRTLEDVMGHSIPFNKTLGSIGILGFILFFAFLISLMSERNSRNPH